MRAVTEARLPSHRRERTTDAKHLLNKYSNTRIRGGVVRLIAGTRGLRTRPDSIPPPWIGTNALSAILPRRYLVPRRCISECHRGGALTVSCAAPAPSFKREIQPILAEHCLKCHGEATRKADLDLRSPATMAKGGVSGPAIERGASRKSLLYEQISMHVMPPGKAAKLSAVQIGLFARWIDAGAPSDLAVDEATAVVAPLHWAFRPPVKSALPAVKNSTMIRTVVDTFIVARLEAKGLALSPEAEKRKLIRARLLTSWGYPRRRRKSSVFLPIGRAMLMNG